MSISVVPSIELVFAAANEVQVFPVHHVPLTINIPAGTTMRVEMTSGNADRIDAGTASWELWPSGDKTGPYTDALEAMCTALRFTCISAGGRVNII